MDFGVFIPIGNNGWLISENSPQYKPSFELNKRVVQEAERQGFAFALSMIKLRGFGGKTEFWDHNLESFTLMAGLAAVTERIKLYASTAVLTLPPALAARMATTIDSIAPGRFGINTVSGWASRRRDRRRVRRPVRPRHAVLRRDGRLQLHPQPGLSGLPGEAAGVLRGVRRGSRWPCRRPRTWSAGRTGRRWPAAG
jgi:alkanesulfonate monooxygenase SsuD/methylene tetrahydromethanopterin reductase-like flavin-dependent oxidoreductase (luciferase family)